MADQRHQQRPTDAMKGMFAGQKGQAQGPPTSKVLAVVTLVPVAGFLLLLSGLTLAATLIGLAVSTPLFVMCSPVLVPAAAVIGLAMTGFLASGAFGITGISSLSWIANYLRRARLPAEHLEHAKRRAQETAGQMGQTVSGKAQETAGRAQEAAGRG
ncbi:oleosin H2-like [Juglans microcarpa x Juglans regia]|uniref:oleosin H2-like n=1 Tax=Juglans microcarpa x Juglans regia TaxID=2249226 RepID=UPI001B7F74D7|nr:oleosin H2-like [Juglans microcarpa x Juglans regia]